MATQIWIQSSWVLPITVLTLSMQIAEEPPPLREIPPDCSPHTSDVIKRGLQREPSRRASAAELRVQTAKALKQRKRMHIDHITSFNTLHRIHTAIDYIYVDVFLVFFYTSS